MRWLMPLLAACAVSDSPPMPVADVALCPDDVAFTAHLDMSPPTIGRVFLDGSSSSLMTPPPESIALEVRHLVGTTPIPKMTEAEHAALPDRRAVPEYSDVGCLGQFTLVTGGDPIYLHGVQRQLPDASQPHPSFDVTAWSVLDGCYPGAPEHECGPVHLGDFAAGLRL